MKNVGVLKLDPNEALSKANDIRTYATNVQEILEVMTKAMNEIDNESTGIYQGTNKARELKEKLDIIHSNFEPIYNQII